MIVIPLQLEADPERYDLVLILEEENISRLRLNDPAEVHLNKLPESVQRLKVRNIILMYGTAADLNAFWKLARESKMREALEHLARGFAVRPGDSDGPYATMLSGGPM